MKLRGVVMLKALITEYGLPWVINRSLYSVKLKMMRIIPFTEKVFEKTVNVKRVNIFDIDVCRIEKFLKSLSDEKKEKIIAIADNAVAGKIKAFSSTELDYGNPIRWHYNPILKIKASKSLKWYRIPDFDPERGDIKVVWEASRFTHFFYLARAYLITKDKKYYDAFSNQLMSWIEENDYSYGPNYKCGQEATLRMINTLITYSIFKSCGFDEQRVKEAIYKLVEGSYKKVLSNFFYAHKCIKNNHTLSEITGLIVGAWCSDDKNKLEKAYRLLDEEVANQFLPDGGYIQYSFNYQRFALQIMEFILKISNVTKIDISYRSKNLIKKSAVLMYQMQDGNGDVPNYGSNDGALLFPVTCCDYRDFRPTINTLYALLESKRLYNDGDYNEELFWFIDNELDNIPIIKSNRISSKFVHSGLYSLRHKYGFMTVVLQNFKARPAQMDQLHIDLWHKGKNIFCDSGTYSYATDIGKHMAMTGSHNTVQVDNIEQMKKHGAFLIYDWSKAKDVEFNENYFKGTMVSKNGYSHTRTINKTEGGYLIEDIVSGNGRRCAFNFHTPCEVKIISDGFELINKDGIIARIISTGSIDVKKVYRSLYYLNKEEVNQISVYEEIKNKQCIMTFKIQLF